MPAYDGALFDPPAPVAEVAVHSPETGATSRRVNLLIDTGADVTLLPRSSVTEMLDATSDIEQYELEGFDGTRSFAPAVRLELYFLGRVFRGRFLIVDQPYGILGRNVLNAIELVLDGPNLAWDQRG